MKKLSYSTNSDGKIDAISSINELDYFVDKDTPFQTIEDSKNYRLINDVFEWFDYTWTYEEFAVKVTIPETVILDSIYYRSLQDAVLGLIEYGFAQQETINNNRVMYFNQLQTNHRTELEKDINVIIEEQ